MMLSSEREEFKTKPSLENKMIVMQIIVIITSINLHQLFEPEVNSNSETLYSHKRGY